MKKKKHKNKKKWIHRAILALACLCILFGIYSLADHIIHPIRFQKKNVIVEYKEPYDAMDNVKSVFLGDKKDVKINKAINPKKRVPKRLPIPIKIKVRMQPIKSKIPKHQL